MRSKEDALDYRYFPEPDLPSLVLDEEILKKLQESDLEIPYLITKKFKEEYGFNKEYINTLINDKITLDYFIEMVEGVETQFFVSSGQFPKLVAKWIS
jgi:aspartyl-tRNA(Asn)/glutamyl-tRNA(Gln) amidotransferase subunit B